MRILVRATISSPRFASTRHPTTATSSLLSWCCTFPASATSTWRAASSPASPCLSDEAPGVNYRSSIVHAARRWASSPGRRCRLPLALNRRPEDHRRLRLQNLHGPFRLVLRGEADRSYVCRRIARAWWLVDLHHLSKLLEEIPQRQTGDGGKTGITRPRHLEVSRHRPRSSRYSSSAVAACGCTYRAAACSQ